MRPTLVSDNSAIEYCFLESSLASRSWNDSSRYLRFGYKVILVRRAGLSWFESSVQRSVDETTAAGDSMRIQNAL